MLGFVALVCVLAQAAKWVTRTAVRVTAVLLGMSAPTTTAAPTTNPPGAGRLPGGVAEAEPLSNHHLHVQQYYAGVHTTDNRDGDDAFTDELLKSIRNPRSGVKREPRQ